MAYNRLTGSIIAPQYFGPGLGQPGTNVISGTLQGDGSAIRKVPRVLTPADNAVVINVDGNSNKFECSANLKFNPSSTPNQLSIVGEVSASANISASFFYGDGSRLTNISSSGGAIGPAPDGSYTDGLFTDFTEDTLIGVPIDRFNEVLKILAPDPAPSVQRINYGTTQGVTAKLSFGSSYPVNKYTSSATAAGFSAVARAGTYAPATSGNNFRLGVYGGSTNITGTINYNVAKKKEGTYLNYASAAFGNAEQGTLKLELNGTTYHSISLTGAVGTGAPGTGSASSVTSNTGFIALSVTASGYDGNGAEWTIFKQRTSKYKIGSADMSPGWNYARVIHTIGSSDYTTNYIEWINDPSGAVNDLGATNARIENITLVGSKYLSGVQYNTDATANYKADIVNLYRNVYAASGTPISFSTTNSSTPAAQSVPDIAAPQTNKKTLGITGSLDVNASVDSLLSGAITTDVTVTHPLKNTISNAGSATTGDGFLVDNRTLDSTNLSEKFHDETYRKTSGSYATQGAVTAAGGKWNSQNHMTASGPAGHTDGLLLFNQRLYSPIDDDIPLNGKFSGLSNVESGQPNYSTTTGKRTFYRVLSNSSGVSKSDFKITSTKNGTAFSNNALDSNDVHFFAKLPGTSGWMDVSQNFTYGSITDGAGALINGANDNSNTTGTGNSVHCITFGTGSVANNEHVMLKIVTDSSWSGYVSQLDFTLGATTNTTTEAPALDDVDANNSGTDAKLSFGSSNNVASYSDALGAAIGLTNYDSNDLYDLSGDRRGIFSSFPTLTGELNEDVPSSGDNYPANAFKDAYSGLLVMEVNGAEVHSVSMVNLNSISNDFNGNDSGFSVSAVDFSSVDGIPSYEKPYRTGDYQVGAGDQRLGWNYARVIHRIGGSDTTTNYVEWVVDTDSNNLASSSVGLSNFSHADTYYQSGIGYFASRPSGSYTYLASNVYRNVYQNGTAISYPTTTNCAVSNIRIVGSGVTTLSTAASSTSLASLNNSANCEQQNIQVTGTVLFDSLTSISGGLGLYTDYDIAVDSTVLHPLKSNLNITQYSRNAFMVYSGSLGSTTSGSAEYFGLETYRIVSGAYANQAAVTDAANKWNSARSVNDAGSYAEHADGVVTANGYAISPLKIGNVGDTRNRADGGSLQAPASNPNYSSLTNATRTYYRYFINKTGLSKATFKIKLYGSANLISQAGAFYTGSLGANSNIQVELKTPSDPAFTGLDDTSTAWVDCIRPYSAGTQPDADGVGILNLGGTDLSQSVGAGGREIPIQLQEKQVRNNQYFILKISANQNWTGYLSRIEIDYT